MKQSKAQPLMRSMVQTDFIEVYEDVLDRATCGRLIESFERSQLARPLATDGWADVSVADGWGIVLDAHPAWFVARRILNDAALQGLRHYLRRYAHAALGTVRLQVSDSRTGAPVTLRARGWSALDDDALDSAIVQVFRPGSISLHKLPADDEGVSYWHSDLHPNPTHDSGESLHRVLLWMIYLNDEFQAGETEFLYQGRKVAPRTGSLLIAPTSFTHTRRRHIPKGCDQYVATSWILFRRAETLYDTPPSGLGT